MPFGLKKNWGQILIEKINNQVKAIGTQASGNKPKDFPLMFAILLSIWKNKPSFYFGV